MITRLKVSNFLSFAGEQTLITTDPVSKKAVKNIEVVDHWRINKLSLIYGPNGSGKSNILKTISYIKEFVLSGTVPYFFVDSNYGAGSIEAFNDRTSEFLIEFYTDGYLYTYALSISLREREIVLEALYMNDDHDHKSKMIFERSCEGIKFGQYFKQCTSDCKDTVKLISKYFDEDSVCFLSRLCMFRDIFESCKDLGRVLEYFKYTINNSYNKDKFFTYDTYTAVDGFEESLLAEMGHLGMKVDNLNSYDVTGQYPASEFPKELRELLEEKINMQVVVPVVDNKTGRLFIFESSGGILADSYTMYATNPSFKGVPVSSTGFTEALKLACMIACREPIMYLVDNLANNLHPETVKLFINEWVNVTPLNCILAVSNNYGFMDLDILNPYAFSVTEMVRLKQFPGMEATLLTNLGNTYKFHSKVPLSTIYLSGELGGHPEEYDLENDTDGDDYEGDDDEELMEDSILGETSMNGVVIPGLADDVSEAALEADPGLVCGFPEAPVEDVPEETAEPVEVFTVDANGVEHKVEPIDNQEVTATKLGEANELWN